jgi:alpha-ketoglutarate-dependent taurine dioxygenase
VSSIHRFGIDWSGRSPNGPDIFEKDDVLQLLSMHGVVVIRGQSLDAQRLRKLARLFGPPMRPLSLTSSPQWVAEALSDERRGYRATIGSASVAKGEDEWCLLLSDVHITVPEQDHITIPALCIGNKSGVTDAYSNSTQIDIIETVGADAPPGTDVWHSDASYLENPPSIGIFYACSAPEDGSGQTLFCDMKSALKSLSPRLQNMLSQCSAIHAADAHVRRYGEHRGRLLRIPAIPSPVEHPVIRSVCGDNSSSLFINPFYTDKIAGMEYDESDSIIDMLMAKCTRPEFVFCHRWKEGDIVIWDNRTSMHYGVRNITKGFHKKLMRVLVEGERPVG